MSSDTRHMCASSLLRFWRAAAVALYPSTHEDLETCSSQIHYTHAGIHVVREIHGKMYVIIHCYINKNWVGRYIYM